MKTMMRCLVVVLSIITISTQSMAQWKQIGPWTVPQILGARINGNSFYIYGQNGIFKIDYTKNKWDFITEVPRHFWWGVDGPKQFAISDSFLTAWMDVYSDESNERSSYLMISSNKGNSWTTVYADSEFAPYEICTSVSIVGPSLFVATLLSDTNKVPNYSNGGLRISRDTGRTWIKTDSISLPGGIGKLYADGNTLYAAGKGLYKSTDFGSNWQFVGIKDSSLNFIAAKGSRILAGHVLCSWDSDSSSSLYLSDDGGVSWKTIWHSDGIILKSAALGDNKVFIFTNDGELFSSNVDGISWIDNTGICSGETPIEVLASGSLTSALFNNAAFISSDNGISWSDVKEGYANTGISVLAASGSNIYAAGAEKFYRSTNNGINWLIVPTTFQQWPLTWVMTIVAQGSVAFAGTGDGLLRSTDNGVRWDNVGAYANWGYSHREEFHSILMNGSEVFAGAAHAELFHSTSYGNYGTWSYSDLGFVYMWTYVSAIAINGNNTFVGFDGNESEEGVYLSTNNGSSWTAVNTGLTNKHIHALVFLNNILFAATESGVFVSTNKGTNWTAINNGLPGASINVNTLLAVGSNLFITANGGIYHTTNYGANWSAVDSGLSDRTSIIAIDGNTCFALTSSGVWSCPLSEMIPTSVSQSSSQLPENYSLSQNYPNPFNPSTTISYSIPERSTIRLSIFNTLGQKISEIVIETKDAGSYEHSFNASQLSSGIYFYRIEATSLSNSKTFVETKKMVLIR